jgi:hypothetical protein
VRNAIRQFPIGNIQYHSFNIMRKNVSRHIAHNKRELWPRSKTYRRASIFKSIDTYDDCIYILLGFTYERRIFTPEKREGGTDAAGGKT